MGKHIRHSAANKDWRLRFFGPLRSHEGGQRGCNYPFLTQKERDIAAGLLVLRDVDRDPVDDVFLLAAREL